MKVLMLSEPRQLNGGIPKYSIPLAESLASKGHEVVYASSGASVGEYSIIPGTRWKRLFNPQFQEYVLRNPVSIGVNFGDPLADWNNKDLGKFVVLALREKPDIIHIHSFLGLPSKALVELSRIAPVFVSVHEFGIFCQQRVLVKHDGTNCLTYGFQSECASCVVPVDRARQRLKWQLEHSAGGVLLRGIHLTERLGRIEFGVTPDGNLLKHKVESGANPYLQRLGNVTDALNSHAVEILAVSNSVRDILVEAGIAATKVSVLHIGSGAAEQLQYVPYDGVSLDPPNFLALTGYVENKGAHVLVEAAKLAQEDWSVTIAGRGDSEYEKRVRQTAPANVRLLGGYDRQRVQELLAHCAALVAPTLGPDTSPQVVFEALRVGRPVIGSRIGGIPDFVRHGSNGMLVEPGNAAHLASILDSLAKETQRLKSMATQCTIPMTLNQHIEHLESRYASALK